MEVQETSEITLSNLPDVVFETMEFDPCRGFLCRVKSGVLTLKQAADICMKPTTLTLLCGDSAPILLTSWLDSIENWDHKGNAGMCFINRGLPETLHVALKPSG